MEATPYEDEMTPPNMLSARTTFVVNCLFYAALSFHVYEWVLYIPEEVRYVWKRDSTSIVKWQYLFSRYGGLFVQASNVGFFTHIQRLHSVSRTICTRWHYFQLFSGQALWSSLEISLIHRLVALYKGDQWVKATVGLLAGSEIAANMVLGFKSIAKAEVTGACITIRTPLYVAIFS